VPAERIQVGSAGGASLFDNAIIRKRGDLRRTRDKIAYCQGLIDSFDIDGTPLQKLATLSGGNIQKLILAREMDTLARRGVLVLDEPVWGLDPGAAAMVREKLRRARQAGYALVVFSKSLDELLELSSRIIVLHGGRLGGDFRPGAGGFDRRGIGLAMHGMPQGGGAA
jgi:ABC-type uncharacterized transport system ATPase subunit